MAIYHNTTKIISRSSGRSCVGASAYRSGEKLHNEYDDITHDYTRKNGIVYTEVMLPEQAKEEFKNREVLWNEVEKIEKSKNSQLAREVEVAIPKELNRKEQINLVRNYVKDNFVNNGMCADVCIHDKEDGNPHAHIMLTMRPIKENGEWGAKSKEQRILDKDGNIQRTKSGRILSKKIDSTNWNTKEFLESYRKDWAEKINEELKKKGINERVDHRSYAEQGIAKEPTIHEGHTAREIEKRGAISDRMEINREVKKVNEEREKLLSEIEADRKLIEELQKEIEEINKNNKSEIKSIDELKNERAELLERYKKVDDEIKNYNEYRKNVNQLKEAEKKLENEQKHRSSLGIFKIAEKKISDNKINNYIGAIKEIKVNIKSLGSVGTLSDEQLQKIEQDREVFRTRIKEQENEIKLREEQQKIEEQKRIENENRMKREAEEKDLSNQRIPMDFRERDREETLNNNSRAIKETLIQMKLLAIDNPELENDPSYKEKLNKIEKLAKKYKIADPQRGQQQEAHKNRGIER